jgi:hypothetical protein
MDSDDALTKGSTRPVGECALCRARTVLRKSHLLPAAAYRLLREPDRRNPNPVMITSRHAGATSRQVSAYLLCQVCEQRFSRDGESLVMTQCARPGSGLFPLRELLVTRVRMVPVGPPGVWRGDVAGVLGDDIDAYLYFAASVFWRASARIWDATWQPFALGEVYQEQFRLYLLGEAGWPENARLVVQVSTDAVGDHLAINPVSFRIGAARRYKFSIPGILFAMWVGPTVSRDYDGGALNSRADGRIMWLCPFRNDSLYQGLLTVASSAIQNPRTLRPEML